MECFIYFTRIEHNLFLRENIVLFVVYEDSIANLDEAVSAVDVTLTEVNFTLSGEIQDVDTGSII